eukprot:s2355_g7.t1
MAPEEHESFIAQPLTPTSMVLNLGCTRAMASRVSAQDLIKFCDQNPDCGIWYTIAETTSQFTFADSESTKCNQKLVVCLYDREYAVQSTEFDIVEQGHVPILMSLTQMRNLRFQFELHPDNALLSSPVLGIANAANVKLKVAPSLAHISCLIFLNSVVLSGTFASTDTRSLIFVGHEEIKFRNKAYLALVITDGYAEKVTARQAVKNVAWARNCQLTVSGYSALEIATGRRPPDLFDVEQVSAHPPDEDRTLRDLQRIAMRAHQEAWQSLDLRKRTWFRRAMLSDGP